jgi:hypothetical protein
VLCRIKPVQNPHNLPITLHELVRNYLAANSPVSPRPAGAARILDASPALLTQVSGVPYAFY